MEIGGFFGSLGAFLATLLAVISVVALSIILFITAFAVLALGVYLVLAVIYAVGALCGSWPSSEAFRPLKAAAEKIRTTHASLCEHVPPSAVLAVSFLLALAFIAVVWHFCT